MMIYKKTDAGEKEILHKLQGLSFLQRSVLLMIDGKRQIADIAKSLSALGSVDDTVGQLLELGLIAPTAENNLKVATPTDAEDKYTDRLFARKSSAILVLRRALEPALGPGADTFMLRLESAIDRPTFTRAIESALSVIEQTRGADARDSLKAALVKLAQSASN